MKRRPKVLLLAALTVVFSACGTSIVDMGENPQHDASLTNTEPDTLAALALKPTRSPKLNCNSDKTLEVPMEIAITKVSSMKIHVDASGGSDKNGAVANYYKLVDASGIVRYAPSGVLDVFRSANAHFNFQGLRPGATYTLSLFTADNCANLKEGTPQTFTMPALTREANPPTFSDPLVVRASTFIGYEIDVVARPDDDTAVARFQVSKNGSVICDRTMIDLDAGTFGLWSWADADNTPPYFLLGFSCTVPAFGTYTVSVFDPFGNVTTKNTI